VSAGIAGGTVTPVTLTSDVGGPVKIKNPWSGGTMGVRQLDASGNPAGAVPFTNSGGVLSFATTAGTSYQVTSTTAAARPAGLVQPYRGADLGPTSLVLLALGLLLGVAAGGRTGRRSGRLALA
jgi:hypothetical protein